MDIKKARVAVNSLIAPLPVEQFVASIWGKGISFNANAIDPKLLLDIAGFESLLSHLNNAQEGWLHLAHGGVLSVPPEMVDETGMLKMEHLRLALIQGYTLYLTKAERLHPALAELAAAIGHTLKDHEIALRQRVSGHLFLTPPEAQGFAPHRDEHASFIIQLEGTKNWTVYEPREVEKSNILRPGEVSREALGGLKKHTFDLAPGDVLFMPEWWPHEARSEPEASLHVTMRMFPLKWRDVLEDLAKSMVAFDGVVPRGGPTATELKEILSGSAFSTELSESMGALASPDEPMSESGFLDVHKQLSRISSHTFLRRKSGTQWRCDVHEGAARLLSENGSLSGPAEFLPVFDFATRTPGFRVEELPELPSAEYDRLQIARALVSRGLFEITDQV